MCVHMEANNTKKHNQLPLKTTTSYRYCLLFFDNSCCTCIPYFHKGMNIRNKENKLM